MDSVDGILVVCGSPQETPATVNYKKEDYSRVEKDDVSNKMRSRTWSFVELYKQESAGYGSLVALCLLCHRLGHESVLFLRAGNISNDLKHFETAAHKDVPTTKQLTHSRAIVYIGKNATGGNRSKVVAEDSTIKRFLGSGKRTHYLSFVRMQVISISPHSLAANDYMRSFLSELTMYVPPAPATVVPHLLKLYKLMIVKTRAKFQRVKQQYDGLPFAHVVCDRWTEKHRSNSFGSIVVRYSDPYIGTMVVVNLGVSLFVGKHDHAKIRRWHMGRLEYFGLAQLICAPPRRTLTQTCERW